MQELPATARTEFVRRLDRVSKKFANDKFRQSYMVQMVRTFLGAQMRALRGKQSQTAFGRVIDKPQPVISRLESESYGKLTISTLIEIAERLRLGLIIRFVDFPTFMKITQADSERALKPESYVHEHFEKFVAREKAALDDGDDAEISESFIEKRTNIFVNDNLRMGSGAYVRLKQN